MIYDIECDGIGYHVCKGESDDLIGSCVYIKGTRKLFSILYKRFPIKIFVIKSPLIKYQITYTKFQQIQPFPDLQKQRQWQKVRMHSLISRYSTTLDYNPLKTLIICMLL